MLGEGVGGKRVERREKGPCICRGEKRLCCVEERKKKEREGNRSARELAGEKGNCVR